MVIELSSHTDSRGNDAYNLDLSQRRANSAKQYLVIKGIDSRRVRAVGYGEKRILNRCTNGVNCSEPEHRINRRTEFTILEGPQTIEVRREPKTRPENNGASPRNSGNGAQGALLPVLRFDDPEMNLGTLKQGEKRQGSFAFVNSGSGPLVIEVASACECTEVEWPTAPIAPGERSEIKIEYNSEGKHGQQEVTLDVLANTEPLVTQARIRLFVEPADDDQ